MSFDFDKLTNLVVVYGINVLGAVVIAVAGWWAASLAERLTRRALDASHTDVTVSAFLASLVRYALLVVTFVVILQVVGIQATSLVAVLGAASLAIGLALQGTLSNMAAGIMLLIFRPFKIDDAVEVGGKSGTVRSLNLFFTELSSGDNVQVLIPNGQVWGAALTNLSAYPTRQITMPLQLTLDADPEGTASELRARLSDDKRVLSDPAPVVRISNVSDKGPELSIQIWTLATDVGSMRTSLLNLCLQQLRKPARAEA